MTSQPTTGRLLEGVVETLETMVLPELPRGGQARRQLHAAIDILRRLAFAAPRIGTSLNADNADILETMRGLGALVDADALARAEALPDREARNAALQHLLAATQERTGPETAAGVTLRELYRRMLERELALTPPPRRKGAATP